LERSAEAERSQQEMVLSTFHSAKSSRGGSFCKSVDDDAVDMEDAVDDGEESLQTKHSKATLSSKKGALSSITVAGFDDFVCSG